VNAGAGGPPTSALSAAPAELDTARMLWSWLVAKLKRVIG
jgi:hypothetical protein